MLDASFKRYFGIFEQNDITFDDERQVNKLMGLLTNVLNVLPIWPNNGWAPCELASSEPGPRRFFNKDGSLMRVGRNDPCPCGSGKKYKHCHGRPGGVRG